MKSREELAAEKRAWYVANRDHILAKRPKVARSVRVCDVCLRSFTPEAKSALDKRCSSECKRVGRKTTAKARLFRQAVKARIKALRNTPETRGRKRRWYLDNRERILAEDLARRRVLRGDRKCGMCSSAFTPTAKNGREKWCSSPCKVRGKRLSSERYWKSEAAKEKLKTPEKKLYLFLRSTLNKRIMARGCRTRNAFPYSTQQLRNHLEGQFLPGMTWSNHTVHGWHIDHIKPLTAFNFFAADGSVRQDQVREAMDLKNLAPLWAADNIRKGGAKRCLVQSR